MHGSFPPSVITLIEQDTPKLNKDIAEGLAVKHIPHIENYVHQIFINASIGFPPGLTYHGYRRLSPQEEFNEVVRKRSAKASYDVARSDVYLVGYKFKYNGEDLPEKYIYLPYVSQGGEIYLGGSRFMISPVLSDRVISMASNHVFVRLLKAKLTFNRSPYHIVVNGERCSTQIPWGEIYNEKRAANAPRPTIKANCTLAHYLFCKYGFSETFKLFAGFTPIIGTDNINEIHYPPDQFKIIASCQLKPRGFGRLNYDRPTNIRLAIPIQHWNSYVENLVTGFFYVVDHFPERFPDVSYVEYPRLWMVLLGNLIWGTASSDGKLFSDVEDHIKSLDEYIDAIVAAKLKEIGFPCNDIYQLFSLVIAKINDWMLLSDEKVSSIYDKELSVLYYVCYDLTASIHKLYFKLRAATKKTLDYKKVCNIMNMNFRTGVIFGITSGHGEVSTVGTSGDNMALKSTLMMVPQASSTKRGKGKTSLDDPSMRADASIVEHGGYTNLPKSNPAGDARVNPHTLTNESGLLIRNEEHRALLDRVQQELRRHQ